LPMSAQTCGQGAFRSGSAFPTGAHHVLHL
jgi:hypothetical protein